MPQRINEQRLFITRSEYDVLVADHADWMRTHWTMSLDRQWSIEGVSVTGIHERISELESMLKLKVR